MKKNLRIGNFASGCRNLFLLILLLAGGIPEAQAQLFQWAKDFSHTSFYDFGNSLAADAAGNSYYGGAFTNNLQIGTYTLNAAGKNMYVAKFDAAGGVSWVKNFATTSNTLGSIYDIMPDAAGNILVTGSFTSNLTIGTINLNTTASFSGIDMFLAKFDPMGNVLWVKQGTSQSNVEAFSLTQDGTGNIYMTGYSYSPSFSFDSQPVTGSGEGFLLKLNSAGQLVWGKRLDAEFLKVATDAAGNGYLTGIFTIPLLALGNNVTVAHQGGNAFSTGFVANFNPTGQFQWAKQIGGINAEPDQVQVDAAGNAFILGTFWQTFNLGTFALAGAPGRPDLFLLKLNNAGNVLWGKSMENLGINFGRFGFTASPMLELDAAGNAVVANAFVNTVRLSPNDYLYSRADTISDVAVVKFSDAGTYLWSERVGGPGYINHSGLAVSGNGNVFLSGEISPVFTPGVTTNFGPSVTLATTGIKAFVSSMLGRANQAGGMVFLDQNNSGTRDAGEPALAQMGVSLAGSPLPALSMPNGRYRLYTGAGTHQVGIPQTPPYYTLAPGSHSVTFAGLGQVDTVRHFALQPIPNKQDLEVSLVQVTAPRPGFTYRTKVTYRNAGTVVMNGSVKLHSDTLLTFLNATPATNTVISDTLSWNFTGLQPMESRYVMVEWQVPVTAALGSKLRLTARVTPGTGDQEVSNNSLTARPVVTGSFDPNDKLVSLDKITPGQVAARQPLVYTVRFQNTGTDTAFTVMVRDELSPLLDMGTLEVVSASHAFYAKTATPGILEWHFPNILLPDSNVNERASHGYVQYRIKPMANLTLGQHILTNAAIYFDFNAPVLTNITDTEVASLLGVKDKVQAKKLALQLWPNPANDQVQLQLETAAKGPVNVKVMNALGQVIHEESHPNGSSRFRKTLSLAKLPAGMYLVQVQQGNISTSRQLILQR